MEGLITSLPNTATGWVALFVLSAIGIIQIVNVLNPQFRARRKEVDELDEQLIVKLRDKLGMSEDEAKALKERDARREEELAHIKGQYSTVIEVLQGRDENTQKAIALIPEMHDTTIETNELQKETHRILNGLATTVMEFGAGLKSVTDALEKLAERNAEHQDKKN